MGGICYEGGRYYKTVGTWGHAGLGFMRFRVQGGPRKYINRMYCYVGIPKVSGEVFEKVARGLRTDLSENDLQNDL